MWKKIKYEKCQDTIWDKVDDSKVNIDMNSIEEFFMKKKRSSPKKKNVVVEVEEKVQKVSLVTSKRKQHFLLILGKLRMDN